MNTFKTPVDHMEATAAGRVPYRDLTLTGLIETKNLAELKLSLSNEMEAVAYSFK